MRIITLLPLAAAVLSVAGCGSYSNPIYGENGIINDRSQNYEQAETAKRLELPPSIQARSKPMQERLDVPNAGQTATQRSSDFIVPRPEFFYADSGNGTVNLKREGSDKVLVVDEPIADVWVQLQDFWRFNNVDLAKSAPQEGVMETVWIDTEGEDLSFVDSMIKQLTFQSTEAAVSNKLRVSLRPVANDFDRTTIEMQHVRVSQDEKDQAINWSDDAEDVGYKTDMMFEMLRYLSKSTSDETSHSLLAMKREQQSQPQMGRDSKGFPALKITVPVDQAWDQINAAIDKTTLDIGTRDRQTGVIYMTYTTSTPFEDTEKMGFFEWLNSDRQAITFSTGTLGKAFGVDGEKSVDDGPVYSSKEIEVETAGSDAETPYSLDGQDDAANAKGFKIWFGGKVIYVFGGDQGGVYNESSEKYEHIGRYQLHMNRTSNGIFLTVKTPEGLSAPAVIADELLWEIKEQL